MCGSQKVLPLPLIIRNVPLESVQCADSDTVIAYDASTLTSTVTFKSSLLSTTATIKFQAPLTDELLMTVPFAGQAKRLRGSLFQALMLFLGIRQRAHIIKQTVDFELHNPSRVSRGGASRTAMMLMLSMYRLQLECTCWSTQWHALVPTLQQPLCVLNSRYRPQVSP